MLSEIIPNVQDPYLTGVAALVGIVAVIRLVRELKDFFSEKPTPSATYMTRSECNRIDEHQAKRIAAIDQETKRLRAELIELKRETAGELREMRGKLSGDIRAVHERVDMLPGQIVAMLHNTGAITS